MRQITDRLLSSVLNDHTALKILDAGCGTGGNLTFLTQYGLTLGVDYARLALEYAGLEHTGKLTQGSVEALPYPDDYFDLITSFDVIYHTGVHDDQRALGEFARVTRPGGFVLVRVPALPALRGHHDDFVYGVRRYTSSDLAVRLQGAGLRLRRMTYANSLLMPAVFISRWLQRATEHNSPSTDVQRSQGLTGRLIGMALSLEAAWIARGWNLPTGVSLFALTEKPA